MSVVSSRPLETARLQARPRSLWSTAEKAEPEWVRKVSPPAARSSGWEKPQARRRRSRLTKPMPLPPHRTMPASTAMRRRRSASGGTPGRAGSWQLAKITAARAPAAAAATSCASSRWLATPRMARSTGCGSSAMPGWQGKPSTSARRGLTGWIAPSKPPRTSCSISCSPNEPGRSLAPTTATERASSMAASPPLPGSCVATGRCDAGRAALTGGRGGVRARGGGRRGPPVRRGGRGCRTPRHRRGWRSWPGRDL